MSEFVIFAEARGESGGLKIAWKSDTEPGPNELAGARAIVSGLYRTLYAEWPDAPTSFSRDEAGRGRKTFG